MTRPARIAQAHAFDPAITNTLTRPAFVELAQDKAFLECKTLREQVLYAKEFCRCPV